MWFSLEVEATQKFVDDLKKLLSLPNVCIYAGIILILVGSLIIFTVALLYLLNRQRANSVASDKITKPEVTASRDKTELVYLDNGKSNEDPHVRSDRKLYPSVQSKLQNQK